MAADRRIDAARQVHLVRPDDLLVERLAHAVQALELEVLPIVGCLEDTGDRVRVVGRKLRIEGLEIGQQALRAGEVGKVGRRLAGEHRVDRTSTRTNSSHSYASHTPASAPQNPAQDKKNNSTGDD